MDEKHPLGEWLELPATFRGLARALEHCDAFCEAEAIPAEDATAIRLIVDEISTNICKYAYEDRQGRFRLRLNRRDGDAVIEFRDTGVAFDPREALEPEAATQALETRRIGGWGLRLVARAASSMDYSRQANENRLQISRCLR